MEISKERLFSAALNLGIPKTQVEALWEVLEKRDEVLQASPFSKLLYYFGAIIIISSMTWLMGLSWEWFGGGGIFLISLLYAGAFTWLGNKLWKRDELKIPAGLLITVAVCMTPLAIFGLETYFNIWPVGPPENYQDFFHLIKSSWIFMEIGTIFAGLIALRFFSFPFITAPIFIAAWYLIMDITPMIFPNYELGNQREWISLGFGLVLLSIAFLIDRKHPQDYAFWAYLFGTLTFWTGFSIVVWDHGEIVFFIYLLINLLMMCFSILLKRRVLLIFGAIGVATYLSHLAYEIFKDSILFPFVLSFIGLFIIYLGILYQKNIKRIESTLIETVPVWMKKLLPYEHED